MSVGNAAVGSQRAAHLGPEKRRPQVLDTALQLAIEQGVGRVSIDQIAKRMGVTRPVVYACFGSRTELLDALLAREEQRLFRGVMAALPDRPPIQKPERLVIQGFQALLSVVEKNAGAWQLVFNEHPDPAIAERMSLARKTVRERVGTLMRPALMVAQVEDIDRKLPVLVELFMSASDGAVRAQMEHKDAWSPDELGELVGRLVFAALRKA